MREYYAKKGDKNSRRESNIGQLNCLEEQCCLYDKKKE